MSFPDRGPEGCNEIFPAEGWKNSLQAEGRGQEHYSMPDSGQWNTIPINITEILGFKNLCHSTLGSKIME